MREPKRRMTIKELTAFGWTDSELRAIYHSAANEDRKIAARKNENSNKSTIVFDVDELEKVRGQYEY